MKVWAGIALVLLSVLGSGCVHPVYTRGSRVNFMIDPPCIKEPVLLQDCDMNRAEPTCKIVKVNYRKGCERLVIAK